MRSRSPGLDVKMGQSRYVIDFGVVEVKMSTHNRPLTWLCGKPCMSWTEKACCFLPWIYHDTPNLSCFNLEGRCPTIRNATSPVDRHAVICKLPLAPADVDQ